MKKIKEHFEMIDGKEVTVTRFNSKKCKSNNVMKAKNKRPFGWREPTKGSSGVSSMYNPERNGSKYFKGRLTAQTKQTGRSSNRITENSREWN